MTPDVNSTPQPLPSFHHPAPSLQPHNLTYSAQRRSSSLPSLNDWLILLWWIFPLKRFSFCLNIMLFFFTPSILLFFYQSDFFSTVLSLILNIFAFSLILCALCSDIQVSFYLILSVFLTTVLISLTRADVIQGAFWLDSISSYFRNWVQYSNTVRSWRYPVNYLSIKRY